MICRSIIGSNGAQWSRRGGPQSVVLLAGNAREHRHRDDFGWRALCRDPRSGAAVTACSGREPDSPSPAPQENTILEAIHLSHGADHAGLSVRDLREHPYGRLRPLDRAVGFDRRTNVDFHYLALAVADRRPQSPFSPALMQEPFIGANLPVSSGTTESNGQVC
jgi:hypothetical protein